MKKLLLTILLCPIWLQAQLTSIPGGMWIPGFFGGNDSSTIAAGQVLNDSDDKIANIFQIPKTCTADRIGFRTSTVTTSDTLKVSLFTVDATTGAPTTTAYGGMVAGTQGSLSSNTWYTVTLGTGANAVRGDLVAAVIEFNSFVAGDLALSIINTNNSLRVTRPYRTEFETGWSILASGQYAMVVQCSDNTVAHIPYVFPWSAITSNSFNSGTGTADEYALKFRLPFPARISGFAISWTGSAAGDFDAVLYDSNGTTVLESLSVDNDQASATAGLLGHGLFDTAVQLSANTFYYLSVKPTTATNVSLKTMDVSSAVFLDQVEGGQDFHLATKLDGGSFSATTTSRPFIFLLFDQFSAGGGGSAPALGY